MSRSISVWPARALFRTWKWRIFSHTILILLYFYFKRVYCIMYLNKGGEILKKSIKILLIVLCYIFLCVFMFSGYKIFTILNGYKQAENMYSNLSNQFVSTAATPKPSQAPADPNASAAPDATPEPTPDINVSPISVDFDSLLATTKDIRGWLLSPDTIINYPVVQAVDNDYYLYRFLDGSSNSSGSLFVDYRCAGDFSSNHTIIYGHNMKDGSMFASLTNYWQQDYYEAHPYLYFNTPTQNYRLEVFSGYVTPSDSDAYTVYFKDSATYAKFQETLLSRSNFDSKVELTENDRIVTFSTCTYDYDDARYVVHAKLVPIS